MRTIATITVLRTARQESARKRIGTVIVCYAKARWDTSGPFVFVVRDIMDFSKLGGLLPAVVQDEATSEVLMVGFMNEEAWQLTKTSGYVTFYSRTRQKLWMKGETSGNRLLVRRVLLDCDEDTVLFKVRREGDGNVCHLNRVSCFCPYVEHAEVGERR